MDSSSPSVATNSCDISSILEGLWPVTDELSDLVQYAPTRLAIFTSKGAPGIEPGTRCRGVGLAQLKNIL